MEIIIIVILIILFSRPKKMATNTGRALMKFLPAIITPADNNSSEHQVTVNINISLGYRKADNQQQTIDITN